MTLTPEREAEIRESVEYAPVHIRNRALDLLAEIDRLRARLTTVEHLREIDGEIVHAARRERDVLAAENAALREAGVGLCFALDMAPRQFRGMWVRVKDEKLARWREASSGATSPRAPMQILLAEIDRLRAEKAALEEQVRANVSHSIALEKAGEGLERAMVNDESWHDALARWREATS